MAKLLELQLQHQTFQWIFRLISFRIHWFFPCSLRDSHEYTMVQNIKSSMLSLLYGPNLTPIHDYWKNYHFEYMDLCQQMMSLIVSILSNFVIAFLPRSKRLVISWFQSPATAIWSPRKWSLLPFYCAQSCLPELDPVFPIVSPTHQEASISRLSSSIIEQIERKS